jgi:hypothetical protein
MNQVILDCDGYGRFQIQRESPGKVDLKVLNLSFGRSGICNNENFKLA